MKYVTFSRSNGASAPGYVSGDRVVSLRDSGFPDLLSVIASGGAAGAEGPSYPLSEVRLLAPIPRPPKIICIGLNYADHAREAKLETPKVPTVFGKFPTAVIGPGDAIVLPKASSTPDYEAEFAFIVGRGGRHIPAGRWRDHVFGYTNFNDVSARDVQMATTQWIMGKTFDTFAPFGPCIVSADEIADPHALEIKLSINGEVLQCSNTRELIFKIPALVEYLSSVFTLEPGDIIATGTPAGVGFARRPPRYLRAGDEVVVSIEGLGELRNPVVAEQ